MSLCHFWFKVSFTNISIKNFRCFNNVDLTLSPGINFFYGPNGSGKTSVLESVFLFSSGKSFKSTDLSSLIKYKSKNFSLKGFDGAKGYIVEINKNTNSSINIKLNNKRITTSKLIREFPCTPIHNNTFSFANASPDFRRKLLDRSIYIAENNFSRNWFSFYRTLKQRNSLIKNSRISDIYTWNKKLSDDGTILNNFRKSFFENTLDEFNFLVDLLNTKDFFEFFEVITIDFFQGWDEDESLLDSLNNNNEKDLIRKTTTAGPHKSDIKFFINNIDARQILSRGEQKIFSVLWSCAQHEVLKKKYNIDATLIIDDIKSELDDRIFNVFVELLKHINNQIIFSCIDDCFSSKMISNFKEFKKFHVEQLG